MDLSDKKVIGKVLGILLTALIALLAVAGYDVQVIQPREVTAVETAGAVPGWAATGWAATSWASERGTTNFNDLGVDTITSTGALIEGSQAVTLTAGLQIQPAYSLYLLSATGAVSMTLAAPGATGEVLYLYADDNYTITVNDTNILSTDGNAVTLGQYDIVEFMSVGTKWVHVAKSADS